MLAARWENVFKYTRETRRCDGDVFPPCYQSLRPASRRRENLPLGVHASAASSRGRVGIAYLHWRSRRRRRSLENAQFCGRLREQRKVSRVFDARVHRRQRLHELPGDGARQQQAAVQVHLRLIQRHPTYFLSSTSSAAPVAKRPLGRVIVG